eukprot:344296_1
MRKRARNHNINSTDPPSQPPAKKQKRSKKCETFISEETDKYIIIHTTVARRQTNTKEDINLKFQRIQVDDNGNAILEIQEPNKAMKAAKFAALNKYKKKVSELLLQHYFQYDITAQKMNKGKTLCVLCGCCGITVDNVEEIISDFMTVEVSARIISFFEKQSESLVVDVRDVASDDNILNMDNKFIEDYVALYKTYDDNIRECLLLFWNQLIQNFKKNHGEKQLLQQFLTSFYWMKKQQVFKQLESGYKKSETFHEWTTFAYGLMNSLYSHFICLLKQELVDIALEKAKLKPRTPQKDTEDKKYLTYGMINSTVNSMLRKYHGFNYNKINRKYLITIANSMLWKYKNLTEFAQNDDLPNKLCASNMGGLRTVKKKFVSVGENVIDKVTPRLNNLFWTTQGDLAPTVNEILEETNNLSAFMDLFDKPALESLIEHYLNKNNNEKHIKIDETLLTKFLKVAFFDWRRGIISRCLWSYVKKYRNLNTTSSLRSKLQIYHLTDKPKMSSLQTN